MTDDKGKKHSTTQKVKLIIQYCKSSSDDCSWVWVKKIQIGSYQNASNARNYSDFTGQVIPLTLGKNYALTLTPGYDDPKLIEAWKVWIDFNQDGDFDDSGEEVFSDIGKGVISGTLAIPSSAKSGKTRLRIVMKYLFHAPPCGGYDFGETEDYTVNLTN